MGRNEYPTVCLIDSAGRSSGLSDSIKGVDGFKKIKGIKRHIITDSQGNILHVSTTCANVNDGKATLGKIAQVKSKYSTLKKIRGDKGYRGDDIMRVARNNGMVLPAPSPTVGDPCSFRHKGVGCQSAHFHGLTIAGVLCAITRESVNPARI
ncbi:MAG: transposase [Muribaculaceae bacterium]|nr:transposase [Muribaculaceae bacterium]